MWSGQCDDRSVLFHHRRKTNCEITFEMSGTSIVDLRFFTIWYEFWVATNIRHNIIHLLHWVPGNKNIFMDQSRYASLHCNNISHWLGAYLDWSLHIWYTIKPLISDTPNPMSCLFSKSSLALLQEFWNSSICLYEIKIKNMFKSTCLTGSLTCPGPSGSGKRWALNPQT